MKRPELEEQIALFLDHELPPRDERRLSLKIGRDPDCRRRFDEACRYHYAEKVAFRPGDSKIIARQIAVLRSRMLNGAHPRPHAGRSRYNPGSVIFPGRAVAAMAAMAAALVALMMISNQLGLRDVDSSLGAALKVEALSRVPAEAVKNEGAFPIDSLRIPQTRESLASVFQLGGLTPEDTRKSSYREIETSLENELEVAFTPSSERERRRLVLVVPRSALPDRSSERIPAGRASLTGGTFQTPGEKRSVSLTYDPSF